MPATARLLIQVVPRLTPGRCGVSDQAAMLASALKDEYAINTAFMVLNSHERCDLPYPIQYCSPSQLLENCLKMAGGQLGAILVHLSGYGYSYDGAPTLLGNALAAIKDSGKFRTAVYFHELFATGMPWKKAFWFSHRQRSAVHKIATDAERLITNTRHHAEWLEADVRQQVQRVVQILPVISAAGEASVPVSWIDREPSLAVFGLPASRRRAYKEIAAARDMLHTLGVKEIVDVGIEFDSPTALMGIPVRRMGEQHSKDLAELFARSRFGFVPHTPQNLAKSSIFASFCAQGTVPVLVRSFSGEVDGIRDGVHVVSPQTAAAAQRAGFDDCSRACWGWYSKHRLNIHALFYAQWLEEMKAEIDNTPFAPGANASIK